MTPEMLACGSNLKKKLKKYAKLINRLTFLLIRIAIASSFLLSISNQQLKREYCIQCLGLMTSLEKANYMCPEKV